MDIVNSSVKIYEKNERKYNNSATNLCLNILNFKKSLFKALKL